MTIFFTFSLSTVRAEVVPGYVITKCQEAVRKANPVQITYNYGQLKLDFGKSSAEISRNCGDNAAGCFHSTERGCSVTTKEQSINISGYTCSYDKVYLNCDFRGATVDITSEYSGCNARAVLRHELQHFMNWKTAKENMLRELKTKLPAYLAQNARTCKSTCPSYNLRSIYEYVSDISDKWRAISTANDRRLDEVDHNQDIEVNYTVCAPYSLEFALY